MRVLQPSVQSYAGTTDGVETMAFIRAEKDSFVYKPEIDETEGEEW